MQSLLRFLGYMCLVGTAGGIVLGLYAEKSLLTIVPSLLISGIVFLAMAETLRRVTRIEFFLKTSPLVSTDRIRTDLGEFEKLGNVEGEAMCAGCRMTTRKAGLYYNKTMDVYYHLECLSRDLTE